MKSLVMCKLNVYHPLIKKYTCFIMFMGFWHAFISMHHVCAWCPEKPEEGVDMELRLSVLSLLVLGAEPGFLKNSWCS